MDPTRETTVVTVKPLSKEIHLCKAHRFTVQAERYRCLAKEEPSKREKHLVKVEKYRKKSEKHALQATSLSKEEEKLTHPGDTTEIGYTHEVKHVLGKKQVTDNRKEIKLEKLMGKKLKQEHLKIAEEEIKLAAEERKHGIVHEKIISPINVLATGNSDKDILHQRYSDPNVGQPPKLVAGDLIPNDKQISGTTKSVEGQAIK